MKYTTHLIAAVLTVFSACGCGGPSAAAPTHDEARKHLETALDAWKAGRAKELGSATPPIRFVDPDQSSGAKLESYAIGDAPTTTDHVVDFPAELSVVDRKKAKRSIKAVFQVVAEPSLAVLRNDP